MKENIKNNLKEKGGEEKLNLLKSFKMDKQQEITPISTFLSFH